MFARPQPFTVARPAIVYPRFGGRPVRRTASGHPVLVVLALVGVIATAALAVPLPGDAQAGEAHGSKVEAGRVSSRPAASVRTTEKADRLRAPFPGRTGCDGVWGDEPLECLLQSA